MTIDPRSQAAYRRDLGDGLVLRWSTADDTARIMALYSDVFRGSANEPPNTFIAAWTNDMMSGRHPLLGADDFALVEDTTSGSVVAASCLMRQTWNYAGVALPVGRPEAVATDAKYRNRGLIRAIFELLHARSTERGDVAQAITGILHYYRQFGYEYAVDLDGYRTVPFSAIPKLAQGSAEPFLLRPATADDLPTMAALYEHDRSRVSISAQIPPAYWQFALNGHSPASGEGWKPYVLGRAENNAWQGPVCGYAFVKPMRRDGTVWIPGLGVAEDIALTQALPSMLRGLQTVAQATPTFTPDAPPASELGLIVGRNHPAYQVLDPAAQTKEPYAWYVRVPDMPGFMRLIAPVLAQRLRGTAAANYSGELKLTFYRGGLRLAFENGLLTHAEPWVAPVQDADTMAGCPPLLFLQLLFGRRSFAELRHVFPDVWANPTGRVLLDALFPPQPSWVLALD